MLSASWDHFDRLIDAYAAASIYVSDLRELEQKIARATADLLLPPPSFDDFTALLSTRAVTRELLTRRIAWAAQHLLNARAYCVASKILVKYHGPDGEQGFSSPLLDQLRVLGHLTPSERRANVNANTEYQTPNTDSEEGVDFDLPALQTIDALLTTPKSEEVWIVKGCSYSQVRRTSPDLWVNADRDCLFGDGTSFMSRLFVPAAQIKTLLAARDLVQTAHPELKVRAAYLILNDPDCSWHFQAHDLTGAKPDAARPKRGSKIQLDTFPVLSTHRDFPQLFNKDAEQVGLVGLPAWSDKNPEQALPSDRPTRALLMLAELWSRQLNRPRRLATARGELLATQVTRTTGLSLPRDQWRHDLEDCLERIGLARRLPDRPGRFAITPKGIARLLLLKQKLSACPTISPAQLLTFVTHQSKLWATAPVA